jgi:hypothetical protein
MKRFGGTVIAITAALFLVQGGSRPAKSGETPADKKEPASQMRGMEHGDTPMGDMNHEGHLMAPTTTQAKLTVLGKIKPNTPVPVVIDIHSSDGKAIAKFDRFQEKLMHLIVVSDNLQFFSHIHPIYKGNGRFEVEAKFPQPGGYTLLSDYEPSGQKEQVSVLKAQVPGTSPPAPTSIDLSHTKTFGNTKVNLVSSAPNIKAGKEVTLMFNLQDANNNKPITDLQPYLGETGHMVILKQSSPLTRADYIHAHALKVTPAGQVDFMTEFPQPGKYKLWGQFNRNGKIINADFWVNVI